MYIKQKKRMYKGKKISYTNIKGIFIMKKINYVL